MQRRELSASLAGFLLLPATVYVTPRRPRKLALSQRRLPGGIFLFLISLLPYIIPSVLL
jgi:hypothetical protein